ncbi:MAG: hypothetical protein QMB63_01485 [Clostridiaceae bacterium]
MGIKFDLHTIYLILAALCLVFILYIDLFLSMRNRVSYLTNGQHVTLFTVPFLLSFTFFILFSMEEDMMTLTVIMYYLFLATYLYLLNSQKVILRSADLSDVADKLNTFLIEKEKNYRMYKTGDRTLTVEINNYKDALTLRETELWVEIHNHIHHDDNFLEELHKYFKSQVRNIKFHKKYPNYYFIVINLFIVVLFFLFLNFIQTH